MKTKILIFLLLTGAIANAQTGYVPRNTKERLIAHASDSTLHGPAGAAPSLRGGWPRAGAIFVDTIGGGTGFHYYLSGSWKRTVDSSELADTAAALRTAIGAGGGGGGTTNHTLLSNLAWASSGHTGNTTSIAAFDGSGAAAYKVIGTDIQAYDADLAAIAALSASNDDIIQKKAGAWTNRTIAQLKTDLNYTIPAQFNPIAGLGISLTGSYPNITFSAVTDTNWVHLAAYGTPNDGLTDTAAIKAAVATGKNVLVDPGTWLWDGYRCTPAKGQIIMGYGLTSIIQFTKDTCDVFALTNDSIWVDNIHFVGKGRGSTPGAEVFTYSNAIYISGNYNRVTHCIFEDVKGSAVHLWKTGVTMYGNEVSSSNFDSCGVGIYALTNAEYGQYYANKMQYCRVGFIERCAGNNNWVNITALYCDYGAKLYGSSGCNGDHGQITASIFNHNTTALDIDQIYNEYSIVQCKFYFGAVNIGVTDTARRVRFQACTFSGNTITTTKALDCVIQDGAFGTTAVTITGTTGIEYCHIMNSVYETTACGSGGGAMTLQGVTDNGATTNHDITLTGTNLKFDNGSTNVTTLHALTSSGAMTLNLPEGNTGDTLATKAYARSVGGGGGGTTYTFSTGLTESSGTVTNNLSVGVTGGQTIKGGTGTTDKLTIQATTGNGTGTSAAFDFKSGNNGATQSAQALNNGSWAFGSTAIDGYFFTKLPNGNGGWLHRDQFSNNIMSTTAAGLSTFQTISSATNSTVLIMRYQHQTSGTVANGLGTGMTFETENNSSTVKETGRLASQL